MAEVLRDEYARKQLDMILFRLNEEGYYDIIRNYIEILLDGNYGRFVNGNLLLAVELVDISLNGFDIDIMGSCRNEDVEFFEYIEKIPMVKFKKEALNALMFIQKYEEEKEYPTWDEFSKKRRIEILNKIKNRLELENKVIISSFKKPEIIEPNVMYLQITDEYSKDMLIKIAKRMQPDEIIIEE